MMYHHYYTSKQEEINRFVYPSSKFIETNFNPSVPDPLLMVLFRGSGSVPKRYESGTQDFPCGH
jgi:hypothetical protein